jgi:hypothetical protein
MAKLFLRDQSPSTHHAYARSRCNRCVGGKIVSASFPGNRIKNVARWKHDELHKLLGILTPPEAELLLPTFADLIRAWKLEEVQGYWYQMFGRMSARRAVRELREHWSPDLEVALRHGTGWILPAELNVDYPHWYRRYRNQYGHEFEREQQEALLSLRVVDLAA